MEKTPSVRFDSVVHEYGSFDARSDTDSLVCVSTLSEPASSETDLEFYKRNGLTDEQIELVMGLSRKFSSTTEELGPYGQLKISEEFDDVDPEGPPVDFRYSSPSPSPHRHLDPTGSSSSKTQSKLKPKTNPHKISSEQILQSLR